MKIAITKLPKSQIEIRGEITAEDFSRAIQTATTRLVASAEIEGFRKGKAPEKLVVEKFGEDKLLNQAAEEALKREWPKILEENKIEAIGPAEFHITKIARGNPLEWLARVAVMPELALPDWHAIAKEINKTKGTSIPEITDKEVDDTLEYIRKSRARNQKIDAKETPLDDEFARSLGNFPTLVALKENIRDGIRIEKEEKAQEAHRARLVEAVAEKAAVEIPQVMIEAERAKMLRELRISVEDMGLKWEDYLAHIKKPESELAESWTKDAEKRVRVGMTLRVIARTENVMPTDEEIAKRAEQMLAPYTEDEKARVDQNEVREYARSVMRNEKVLDLLENMS